MRAGFWVTFILVLVTTLLCTREANATAGFAEWQVFTPGGHVLSHVDGWKEEHGDCIRTADSNDYKMPSVLLVDHLKRWRYYEGFIIGEREGGYFILNEKSQAVQHLASEELMNAEMKRMVIGEPLSKWLSGGDGWQEAWFLQMIWAPCKKQGQTSGKETVLERSFGPTEEQCKEAKSGETLRLYKRTSWGRACRQMRDEKDKPLRKELQELHKKYPEMKAQHEKEKLLLESLCQALDAV